LGRPGNTQTRGFWNRIAQKPKELSKMIVVDYTETRKKSRLAMDDVKVSAILEQVTGADVMITRLGLPVGSENMLRRHVEAGALLVQRKSLRDLVESCRRNLKVSVARMQAIGAQWWQCCVLASGVFMPDMRSGNVLVGIATPHQDGRVTFHWQKTTTSYKAFATAKRRLRFRGAWLEILSCDDEIPGWLRNVERDLESLARRGVKEVYPDLERFPPPDAEPLQEVREIVDARTVIAALDGVGPVRATALWETIEEFYGRTPTLGQMLVWACVENPDYYKIPKVPGWGKGTRRSVREQIPLCEGQDLAILDMYVPEKGEDEK